MRPPKGTTHVVLDTPAGLHGKRLDEVMKLADKVLIPLQPSIFDIHATHEFINQLLAHRRSQQGPARGGRHAHARGHDLHRPAAHLPRIGVGVPLLGFLRDTQNYVHLAAHGLTLWDVSSARFERDREQWEPIMIWVELNDRRCPSKGGALRGSLAPRLASSDLVGQHIGVSDWITVTQERIQLFADATNDHQWIHVDPERAKAGPFGTTIAHGFITLSLLPEMARFGDARCSIPEWASTTA